MKLIRLFTFLFILLAAPMAFAQDSIEGSAGFTASHFDAGPLTTNQQGWLGTVNYNVIRFGKSTLAASAEGSGSYSGIPAVRLNIYRVHGGGELSYGEETRIFGRFLAGRTYRDAPGVNDDAFSAVLGGGLKVPVYKRVFLRTGADYLVTRFAGGSQNSAQVHIGFGIKY